MTTVYIQPKNFNKIFSNFSHQLSIADVDISMHSLLRHMVYGEIYFWTKFLCTPVKCQLYLFCIYTHIRVVSLTLVHRYFFSHDSFNVWNSCCSQGVQEIKTLRNDKERGSTYIKIRLELTMWTYVHELYWRKYVYSLT